jgi:DNA-binding CsgD family transcriptional regulator
MYGLTVSANDLQYRHGAFRDAELLWEEIIALAERHGAISWQAQANNQITWLQIALGRFAGARAYEARANALLDRLGPGRRSHALTMEMATAFALELGGDWPALAEFWSGIVDDPALGPHDPGTLIGTYYAALAAYCRMEAGERDSARAMLDTLTLVLQQLGPIDANHNGAVAVAAAVVWRLGLADLAPAYLRLALDLQEAGLGDYPQTSIALSVARMAALTGRQPEAAAAFARARETLELSGQRPLRAVVDLDEATHLLRLGDPAAYPRIAALLDAATAAFDALGMEPWSVRARAIRAEADQRLSGKVPLPGGITEREADVVRLVARGYSDRQISNELYISPRTVNAHLRNMLNKTGTANRTELSVWAIEHGLLAPESASR